MWKKCLTLGALVTPRRPGRVWWSRDRRSVGRRGRARADSSVRARCRSRARVGRHDEDREAPSSARLEPRRPLRQYARTSRLGNAAKASSFDASKFGAVYLDGGLGFNEDVAYAEPGGGSTKLTAN